MKDNEWAWNLEAKGKYRGNLSQNAMQKKSKASDEEKVLSVPLEKIELSQDLIKNREDAAWAFGYDRVEIENMRTMTLKEADEGRANSVRDRDNCQSVALVFEARLRGLDLEAHKYEDDGVMKDLAQKMELGFIGGEGVVFNSGDEVQNFFKERAAKNGRYLLGWEYTMQDGRMMDGHIVNVIMIDGKEYVVDEQLNYRMPLNAAIQRMFFGKKCQALRVDNLPLNVDTLLSVASRR